MSSFYKSDIQLVDVKLIFDELGATSSRNEKEAILKKYENNELFKKTLFFLYNPYIITGISTKKISKGIEYTGVFDKINSLEELINYFNDHKTGTDNDLLNIQEFIYIKNEKDVQEFLKGLVTKSLKVGITSSTINKVYGEDFIPTFDVMLAEKYFECEDKVNDVFLVTQKLDGVRCVIIKENGNVTVMSRQGQPIEGLVEILKDCEHLPDNQVFDGELLKDNTEGLSSKDLYRETVKITNSKGEKKGLIFNAFDMLPLDEFKKGKCTMPCISRKTVLDLTIDNIINLGAKHIIYVPILYTGKDKSKIIELLYKAIEQDQEGVMVNLANAPYECKRTKSILKVKKMNDCDLRVVGFEEGEGNFKGTLGRINVMYKGNQVGVGSGFTQEMRNEVWKNQDKYMGTIAKIQYFEESQNSKTGKVSLRFPIFLEWRTDKDEESYN